jgi:hypothetical protein
VLFIILAFQILSSGLFLNELIKFRNLVSHYQEHNLSGKQMSFVGFIRLHYFDPQHQGADPQKHASLPLQQSVTCYNYVFQALVETVQFNLPAPQSESGYNPVQSGLIPQYNHSAIFQPPRQA